MRIATRHILPSLCLLACMHPISGMACAILPPDKDAERGRQIVEEAKAETRKLKEEADLIFIGYLKKLDVEQETVETPNGKQVMHRYRALFEASEEIKGQYPTEQTLEFTVNKYRIWMPVGCRPQYWQLPKENGVGEKYLVYARDGKVLRTNHIPMDGQAMSGLDEAEFVRGR